MSFASKVKSEICTKPISQRCCARAELAGIIEFGGRIDVQQIRLTTENPSVAKRSYSLFKFVYGVTPITYTHKNKTQKSINMYYTELSGEDAVKIKEDLGIISNIRISEPVIRKECCKRSYIKGAFLGSGSVSDPEKGYHLEFVTHYKNLSLDFAELLNSFEIISGQVIRKGHYVTYFKNSEVIGDLLNIIGGHSCMMDFLNTKIMKDMKNNINRVVNCENANLSKIVDASLEQREAVRFLREKGLFSLLPPTLAEIAVVREENPDASIAELGKLLSPPLSKSGVNHRLTKLMKFAEQYMK